MGSDCISSGSLLIFIVTKILKNFPETNLFLATLGPRDPLHITQV